MNFKEWACINLDANNHAKVENVARKIIDLMKKEKLTQYQASKVLDGVKVLLTNSKV